MNEEKVEKGEREEIYKKRGQRIRDLIDEVNRWCRKWDETIKKKKKAKDK